MHGPDVMVTLADGKWWEPCPRGIGHARLPGHARNLHAPTCWIPATPAAFARWRPVAPVVALAGAA